MAEDTKDLSALLGLDGLTAEELGSTLAEIAELLMTAVTIRVVPLLSPGEQLAYEELLSKNATPEEVYEFLNEATPDLDKIVTEEMQRLRSMFEDVLPPLTEEETADML